MEVEFLDGLYKGITGVVESSEEFVTVKLDLLSQQIRLQWLCP
jgi:hypothetical protein